MTLGKVNCHRHGLGVGAKIDRFSGGGRGFRSKSRQNPKDICDKWDVAMVMEVDDVVMRTATKRPLVRASLLQTCALPWDQQVLFLDSGNDGHLCTP